MSPSLVMDPSDPLFERAVQKMVRKLPASIAPRIADDVAQEIRLALWRRPCRNPNVLAYSVLIDELRKFLGDKKRILASRQGWGRIEQLSIAQGVWEDLPGEPWPEPDPHIWRHVHAALERLAPRDRLILHLYFWQDLNNRQISKRLGLSETRTSVLIQDVQERFREAFKALAQ